MTPPRLVVVDTNVVVAGLLTPDPAAPTARILDAMLAGSLQFVLSVPLLAEYRAVLLRPRIRERHGLTEEEVDAVLAELTRTAVVLDPEAIDRRAPDRGDQLLWDLVEAVPGTVLVTGDGELQEAEGLEVLAPRDLVARLPARCSGP